MSSAEEEPPTPTQSGEESSEAVRSSPAESAQSPSRERRSAASTCTPNKQSNRIVLDKVSDRLHNSPLTVKPQSALTSPIRSTRSNASEHQTPKSKSPTRKRTPAKSAAKSPAPKKTPAKTPTKAKTFVPIPSSEKVAQKQEKDFQAARKHLEDEQKRLEKARQHQKEQIREDWKARTKSSPFNVDLVEQERLIQQQNEKRKADEAKAQRVAQRKREKLKSAIVAHVLSETQEQTDLRQARETEEEENRQSILNSSLQKQEMASVLHQQRLHENQKKRGEAIKEKQAHHKERMDSLAAAEEERKAEIMERAAQKASRKPIPF